MRERLKVTRALAYESRRSFAVGAVIFAAIGATVGAITVPTVTIPAGNGSAHVVAAATTGDRVLSAVLSVLLALVVVFVLSYAIAWLRVPRHQLVARVSDLQRRLTEVEASEQALRARLSRNPVPHDHAVNLRNALTKLIDHESLTIDDYYLLDGFEEHTPGNATWDAHRELITLRPQYADATKRHDAWLWERVKDLRLPGNAGALQEMFDIRRQQMNDDHLTAMPWEWVEEPILGDGGLRNLRLGNWPMGWGITLDEIAATKTAVEYIWEALPERDEVKEQMRLALDIRARESAIWAYGTTLKFQSLDGTRCDLCDPPTPNA